MNAEWVRMLLLAGILGMAVLAAFYLRGRKLTNGETLRCGILFLVPLLGPFLIIVLQPGEPRKPTVSK
jgi:hypothetical protein